MAVNNYDAWRRDWRARFLSLQKEDLLRKLPCLEEKDGRIWITYLARPWAIRLCDGEIEPPAGMEATLYDEMNIFTHLWYAKEGATLTGEWLPFAQLKNTSPFAAAFQKGNLQPLAATFSGHMDKLQQALEALGGRRLKTGDVGYEISVFPCIPMQVLFWEGDEDFPAQANLLFDRSITDFIHPESVVTIASEALRHLTRLADLPIPAGAF